VTRFAAAACLAPMELITILNRCHRFPGFAYQQARLSADRTSIEIAVRPRKRSKPIFSRCHQPARGYDQLAERRFEFIPLWGFFAFLLYAMRRVDCNTTSHSTHYRAAQKLLNESTAPASQSQHPTGDNSTLRQAVPALTPIALTRYGKIRGSKF